MEKAQSASGYKKWSFEIPPKEKTADPSTIAPRLKGCIQCVYPMWQGYRRASTAFQAHSMASYHQSFNTVRSQLVRPKDKTPLVKQCGLVYEGCGVCHKQYIRETERTIAKRFKEHTDSNHPSSTVQEHINLTCHPVTFKLVKMLCKENNKTRRSVKEAIEVYKDGPALNRDHACKILPVLPQLVSHDLPGHMEQLAIPLCDQVTVK